MDYKVNSESIFDKYETRRYLNDNRGLNDFTNQLGFLGNGVKLSQLPYNQLLVSPDSGSLISTNKELLNGYKYDDTSYYLAVKGTRPQVRTNSVSGGAPTSNGSHLLYWRSAGTISVTRDSNSWYFGAIEISAPYKELFIELQGAGGSGSAAGATGIGNRGVGGGAGAWALYRVRLDIGMTLVITVGTGGASASEGGNGGGPSSITIGSETATCGGGLGGSWGGWGDGRTGGGQVTGTSNGTYIKRIQMLNGGTGRDGSGATEDQSISVNDGTPESNVLSRFSSGATSGSSGGAGASSLLGVGGAGSSGGTGNSGNGYGSAGGGGGRDSGLSRKNGGPGANGWVGIWY